MLPTQAHRIEVNGQRIGNGKYALPRIEDLDYSTRKNKNFIIIVCF